MSTAEPLVSFVVPCYNYGRYLPDCLDGIFAQHGYTDFEILAVDDCSTDDTPEVLARYADPRLRVFRHEVNRGHVVTVNEGLAAARGRFVARIDPDDRYRPNFLKTLLPRFEESPRVGLVYGDAALIDHAGNVTAPSCDAVHGGKDFRGSELLAILEKNFLCAPTAVARREAWQKHLPIWEGLAFNDWYFNVMIARDYEFCYVNEVVADYRVHATNWHARVAADKTEEPSLFRVLDWVFAHPEADPELEARKRAARGRIYAAHYLDLGRKYFGIGYDADARRCFWQVWRRRPRAMLRAEPLRLFLATYLGRGRYEAVKRLMRKVRGRQPVAGNVP
jgi:glycosyltransferase involved in cell wall biosynthesis